MKIFRQNIGTVETTGKTRNLGHGLQFEVEHSDGSRSWEHIEDLEITVDHVNSMNLTEQKELLVEGIKSIQTVTTDGFEGEKIGDGTAYIYELSDGYAVLIDTLDNDEVITCKQIDEAQKLATDKLYYHTF